MKTPQPPSELDRLLVSTKFAPPRIGSRFIVRTHLLKGLWRDRRAKLALIAGSAGFGKTILLAQWRQELMKGDYKVCWLSLSPDEKSFSGFATHLFAALARLEVAPGYETLLQGDNPGPGQIAEAVAAIVNALSERSEDVHLLIDDYHHVEDPWAHLLLQKLLDLCPANLHITLASRTVPPLSIGKLRVMDQVAEVECAELPFNLVETRLFLKQNLVVPGLNANEVIQVHELTNGWPASLQLIAIMLRNHPEGRNRLRSLGWRSSDLHTYLSEEVVGTLPSDIVAFMEKMSICRRFTASLARAITGRADADELIARIEQENLLLVRVESDDRSPWFRFHPLFAEFLGARLAERDGVEVDELHRRASAWFDERRHTTEAIRHASLGRDPEAAVAIVERSVPDVWQLSDLGPLLHLMSSLPLPRIAAHPRLAYLGSLTLALTGAPMRASAWSAQLRDQDGAWGFRRALVEAMIAFQDDDTHRAVLLTDAFLLPDDTGAFERHAFLALRVTALAAAGRFDEAYAAFDLYPIRPENLNDSMALLALGCRVIALLLEGRVAEALPLAQDIYARHATLQGHRSAGATLGAVGVVDALYELDRIGEARDLLADRQHSLKRSSPQIMILSSLAEVRLEHLQVSPEAALAVLDERIAWFRSIELHRAVAYMLLAQLRLHLARRDMPNARTSMKELAEIAGRSTETEGFAGELPILLGIGRARMALVDHDHAVAMEAIEAANQHAERLGRGRWTVLLDLLRAQVLDANLETRRALEVLERALARAARLGLVRTFADEGPAVLRLLTTLVDKEGLADDLRDYGRLLLTHFAGQGEAAGGKDAAGDIDKQLLTPREIEILRLVAAGMSNKRAALTVGISLETVKWNLKNVFLKLGVSSRYDAMIWARRNGLID